MKRFLLWAMILGGTMLLPATAQVASSCKDSSPKEVVEHVWKLATQGELLYPQGWDKVARSYFSFPAPLPGSRVTLLSPKSDKVVLVVSNDWTVLAPAIDGKTAKVRVQFYDAGQIDSRLRYTAGKEPEPIGKTEIMYTLVMEPTHWPTYRGTGNTLEIDKENVGPAAWQIENPQDSPWATVNTAIRYVLEMRNKSTDAAIRKNADETLEKLLRLDF